MKSMKYAFLAVLLTAVQVAAFSQSKKAPAVPVLREYVGIWDYEPFYQDSKIAKLDGAAALLFEKDWPRLDGATSLYPVYSSFVNAVYVLGDVHWRRVLACSTTPRAYSALIQKAADIIFCYGPSEEQREMAAQRGGELHLTPLGKDAFVFFVNKNNPVDSLTVSQIRDIYSGEITNWKLLGGNDEEIIPFQRQENSGSQSALESIMGTTPIVPASTERRMMGMEGVIVQVSDYRNYHNAMGYSFLFFTREMVQSDQIKILSIDGVFPDLETVENGTYPFTETFYAITMGEEKENVKEFIRWMLSEQGQGLIEQTGYVPIKRPLFKLPTQKRR
jgi:phosphate transport system substrate-binding protein